MHQLTQSHRIGISALKVSSNVQHYFYPFKRPLQQYRLRAIKLLMLSRHPFSQIKQKHEVCNCSLVQFTPLYTEQGSIKISCQKEISQIGIPIKQSRQSNRKYSFNRQKTSLRGSRVGKEKENPQENASAETNLISSATNESSLMFASNSFSQDKEQVSRRVTGINTCKTSIFFKNVTHPVQTSYGRSLKEEEQYENPKTKKQADRSSQQNQERSKKVNPSREAVKLSQISNETQFDYLRQDKNLYTEDRLQHQKITQYHSQQDVLTSQDDNMEYSQQLPSIIPKRKTAKVLHHIQELKFKSTESIEDPDCIEVSEVISDIVDSQSLDNLSEQRLPQNKRLSYLLKTRFSRMEDR